MIHGIVFIPDSLPPFNIVAKLAEERTEIERGKDHPYAVNHVPSRSTDRRFVRCVRIRLLTFCATERTPIDGSDMSGAGGRGSTGK